MSGETKPERAFLCTMYVDKVEPASGGQEWLCLHAKFAMLVDKKELIGSVSEVKKHESWRAWRRGQPERIYSCRADAKLFVEGVIP